MKLNENLSRLNSTVPFFYFALVLLILGLGACRQGDSEADVEGLDAPQYELVEVFRLGGVEPSEPEMFDRVPTVIIDDADTLYVLHRSQGLVAVFTPEGEFARWIRGGRGEGPGEFNSAARMGLIDDTLWVRNMTPPRISQFLTDGTHVRSDLVQLPPPYPSMAGAQGVSGYLASGRAWIEPDAPPQALQEGLHPEAHLELTVRPGETSLRDTVLSWRSNRGRVAGLQFEPIPEPPFFSVSADGSAIGLAEWNDQDPAVLMLRVLNADGTKRWKSEVPVRPAPVGRGEQDSLVAAAQEKVTQLREQLLGYGLSAGGVPTVPTNEEMRTILYLPSHRPPIRNIHLGVDGTMWLELSQRGRWVAVDDTGSSLLMVSLPASAVLGQATRESIWYSDVDELGVPSLLRATFTRPLQESSASR